MPRHRPCPVNGESGERRKLNEWRAQWVESRLWPHQAKARPPRPTSSTPAMMLSSPGSPKPGPPPLETAAAEVGLADLVNGLFQFESVDGLADGVALVAAWAEGAS